MKNLKLDFIFFNSYWLFSHKLTKSKRLSYPYAFSFLDRSTGSVEPYAEEGIVSWHLQTYKEMNSIVLNGLSPHRTSISRVMGRRNNEIKIKRLRISSRRENWWPIGSYLMQSATNRKLPDAISDLQEVTWRIQRPIGSYLTQSASRVELMLSRVAMDAFSSSSSRPFSLSSPTPTFGENYQSINHSKSLVINLPQQWQRSSSYSKPFLYNLQRKLPIHQTIKHSKNLIFQQTVLFFVPHTHL